MSQDKYLGHEIECIDDDSWVYSDTKESVSERACGYCGKNKTKEGYDGCLGTLPDVNIMNACCGHGSIDEAYIQFWDRNRIAGDDAINYINKEKGSIF